MKVILFVILSFLTCFTSAQIKLTKNILMNLKRESNIMIPNGEYILTENIELPSNVIIKGENSTHIHLYNSGGFKINHAENIKIQNITFTYDQNGNSNYAIKLSNSSNIKLSNVVVINGGLLTTEGDYQLDRNNFQYNNENLCIKNCNVDGKNNNTIKGILVTYSKNFAISNCNIKNVYQGIQWWGGDSDPKKDGVITNRRLCVQGILSHDTVSNVKGGGIWGSMGDSISIVNCNVSNCKDVGIDFEGCTNSNMRLNMVSNCNNGAVSIFHYNKNIEISNNDIIAINDNYLLFCLYNSTEKYGNNSKIIFRKNNLICRKGIGKMIELGCVSEMSIDSNKFKNITLDFANQFNQGLSILSNKFTFSATPNKQNFFIQIGNTNNEKLIFSNNIIDYSTVRIDSNFYPILIQQELKIANNMNSYTELINNKFLGNVLKKRLYLFNSNGMQVGKRHEIILNASAKKFFKLNSQIENQQIKILE